MKLPKLPVYEDKNYRAYNDILANSHNYLYENKNPFIRAVQESGHKIISKLFSGLDFNGEVLDLGGGTGMHMKFNKKIIQKKYTICDADKASLDKAKTIYPDINVVESQSHDLPFKDEQFSVVISIYTLEHLPYLDWSLEEIKRVMKPNGVFLVSIPTEGGLFWTLGRKLSTQKHFGKELSIDYERANLIDHFNTANQVERAIRRYFKMKKRVLFPFNLVPSFNMNFTVSYVLTKANAGDT